MKPDEARRRRKAREQQAEIRGEKLEAFLRTGVPEDKPTPELVPTAADKTMVFREYRRLARLAAGAPAVSAKRRHLLDRAIVQLARLVYIERVLELEERDPTAHAALTAVDLVRLSVVDPEEIRRRFMDLQAGGEAVAR